MGRITKTRLKTKAKDEADDDRAIDKITGTKPRPRGSKRRGSKKTTRKASVARIKENNGDPEGKMSQKDQVVFEIKRKREKITKPPANLTLINGESKNDSFNLRTEVFVKRRGGLVLSWTGSRVEIPQGAVWGPKNRLISAFLPPPIRAYACPWLGPNLRLGSEVHLVWSSVKLRKPAQVFIPFSYAAVLEMTTAEATKRAEEAYVEKVKAAREAAKEEAKVPDETTPPDGTDQNQKDKAKDIRVIVKDGTENSKTKAAPAGVNRKQMEETDKPKKEKKKGNQERKSVNYVSVGVPLLDTRSVYVLQSKIGDDFWTLKQGVEIIQPTIHYSEWPNSMRERAYQAGRFSDDPRSKSIPSPLSSVTSKSSSAKRRGHKPSSTVNDIEQEMRSARDGVTNLEVTKKSAAFTGGVSFSTNDLDHFIVIVIGTPSETVTFDKDGGLLKSPIIHPFFSVRVPKLALEESQTSTFKAVQMRKELMESIQHFDSQLTEINECSNIYELDLGNKPFERPVTITLPLPQWYTRMIERLQAPPQPTDLGRVELTDDTELQTSTVGFSVSQLHENTSRPTEIERGKKSIQMNLNNEIPFEERPKNLILLYQRPFMKRHLVWRACSGDVNSDNMSTKRQNKTGPYRDSVITPMLRGDNMNAKNGWIHLLLGLKGAPWKDVPVNGPFTPRCLQINTYQLGRFAMVYSNEPLRTPSSRVAHLMSRLEALSVAPPGVLLPCLRADPAQIQLSVDCVPITKLISYLEERLSVGFIPLIQSSASFSRRCAAVANSAYQRLIKLHAETQSTKAPVPTFGTSRYRVNGYDLLRVLLYNGLCIRVVVKGHVQIRTRGIFDCLASLLEVQQQDVAENEVEEAAYPSFDAEAAIASAIADSSAILTGKAQKKESVEERNVPRLEQYITAQETRFSFHDLISDTATIIDLEPLKESIARESIRIIRKHNLIQNLMKRRLQRLEESQKQQADTSTPTVIVEGQDQISLEIDLGEDELEKSNHNVNITSNNEGVTGTNNLPPLSVQLDDEIIEDRDHLEVSTQSHNTAAASISELDENDEGQKWLPSCPEDGDDEKTTKDVFQDLQEAFSGTNPTLLSAQVNKDLCRRLTTLYDKGLSADANEMINYVYDIYAMGKVEIYLVQPNKMSQVREVSDENEESGGEKEKFNNSNPNTSNVNASDENENNEDASKGAVLAHNENEKLEKGGIDGGLDDRNQSNMKWKRKLDIADPKVNEEQPLASYDILIDPDIFMNWNPKPKKGGKS